MSRVNMITFRLQEKVQQDEIICIQFRNCTEYENILIPTRCNTEKDRERWAVTLEFDSSPGIKHDEKIFYKYVVVSELDLSKKIRDVINIETRKPMELSFERSSYLGNYVEISDQNDYQWMNSRVVKVLKSHQIVTQTIRLQHTQENQHQYKVKFHANKTIEQQPRLQIIDQSIVSGVFSSLEKSSILIQEELQAKRQHKLYTTYNVMYEKKKEQAKLTTTKFIAKCIIGLLIWIILTFINKYVLMAKFMILFCLLFAMISVEFFMFIFKQSKLNLHQKRTYFLILVYCFKNVWFLQLTNLKYKFLKNPTLIEEDIRQSEVVLQNHNKLEILNTFQLIQKYIIGLLVFTVLSSVNFLVLVVKFVYFFTIQLAMVSIELFIFIFKQNQLDVWQKHTYYLLLSYCYKTTWSIKLVMLMTKFYGRKQKGQKFYDTQSLTKLLSKTQMKYEIVQNCLSNGQVVNRVTNVVEQSAFPKDITFIYRISQDAKINVDNMFTVNLVIKKLGVFRMNSYDNKKRNSWTVRVPLSQNDLKGLEYYFDLNMIQNNASNNRYKLRTTIQRLEGKIDYDVAIFVYSCVSEYNRQQYYPIIDYSLLSIIKQRYNSKVKSEYYFNKQTNQLIYQLIQNENYFSTYCKHTISSTVCYSNPLLLKNQCQNVKTKLSKKIQKVQVMNNFNQHRKQKKSLIKSVFTDRQISMHEAPHIILQELTNNQIIKNVKKQDEVDDYIRQIKLTQQFHKQIHQLKQKLYKLTQVNPQEHQDLQKIDQLCFSKTYQPLCLKYYNPLKSKYTTQIITNFRNWMATINKQVASIQQEIRQLKSLQTSNKQLSDQITGNTVQILSINIIVQSKLWGKNSFKQQKITQLLKQYLPSKNQQSLIRIVNIIYYLNLHAHEKQQYTHKVNHKFSKTDPNCQNTFQQNVQSDISLLRSGKQRQFSFVQNDKLYKLLVLMVDSDIDGFVQFGKQQAIMMQTDQVSTNLMRVLINYAIIYTLGTYYDEKMKVFNSSFCAQFDPFCQQSDKRFLSQDLKKIQYRYLEVTQSQMMNKEKKMLTIKELQKKLENVLNDKRNKQVIELISLDHDLEKVNEYLYSNQLRKELIQDKKLTCSFEQFLMAIDHEKDNEIKMKLISQMKTHRYIQSIMMFD